MESILKKTNIFISSIYLINLILITFSLVRIYYPYLLIAFSPIAVRYKITVIAMSIVNAAIPIIAIYILVLKIKLLKTNKGFLMQEDLNINIIILRIVGIFIMATGLIVSIITIAESIFYYKSSNWLVMINSLWKLEIVGVILFDISNLFSFEEQFKNKLKKKKGPF